MPTGPESEGSALTERINNGIRTVETYAALPLYASNERFQDRVDTAEGSFRLAGMKMGKGDTIAATKWCTGGELELVGAKAIIDLNSPKDRSSVGKQ